MYCSSYVYEEIGFINHYAIMVGLIEPKGYKRSSHNYFQYKLLSPNTIKIH